MCLIEHHTLEDSVRNGGMTLEILNLCTRPK